MTRKIEYLLSILLSLMCGMIYSQNPTDSVLNVTTKETVADTTLNEQMNTINLHRDSLLQELERKQVIIKELSQELNSYSQQVAKSDTFLINISSNYIYIPYEEFSVEKLAIPTFNLVFNRELKNQHKTRLTLLENYHKDIESLNSLLSEIIVLLSNPYAKGDVSKLQIPKMKEKSFYLRYLEFKDFENTFIGKKFVEIENRLEKHDGDNYKANFDDIIEELNNCLKTKNDL